MKGVVVTVFLNKGYGFIRDELGFMRFMHAHQTVPRRAFDTLHEGQPVEFDPVDAGETEERERGNGLRATNIRVIA